MKLNKIKIKIELNWNWIAKKMMQIDAHDIGNKLVTSIICDYGVEKKKNNDDTTHIWKDTFQFYLEQISNYNLFW